MTDLCVFTAPAEQLLAGARILQSSIERGDWDEDTCDLMSSASGALVRAAEEGDADEAGASAVSVSLERDTVEELWAVLGSDAAADRSLHDLITALDAALART